MDTKQKGTISEAYVSAKLLECGFTVLDPRGDNAKYDLVVDHNGKFIRIQVKTGRLRDGKIIFPIKSTRGHRGKRCESYVSHIEYIMVYCPDYPEILLIDINDIKMLKNGEWYLRVKTSKSNRSKNINWVYDYHFDPIKFA